MKNRLLRVNSSKAERRIGEILKRNRIKFKVKWRIGKYECDFLIGKVILEVDGNVHKQINRKKDIYFSSQGFIPLHIRTGKYGIMIEQELLYLIKSNNKKYVKRNL